jgi:DNA-binding transcriptional regulator YdaS (Cro superfamily)
MASHPEAPLLCTVREVVDVLGGTSVTAARLNVSPSAVSIWMRKGCLPPARYLDISAAVEEFGHRVERSLFRESPRLKSETHAA